jgi:hypothetical protein
VPKAIPLPVTKAGVVSIVAVEEGVAVIVAKITEGDVTTGPIAVSVQPLLPIESVLIK